MTATPLTKRVRLSLARVIQFHLLTELVFFRGLTLIASDLTLLTELAQCGQVELPTFCFGEARRLYPTCPPESLGTREQHIRNRLVKLTARGLVVKTRPGSVTLIQLASDLAVDTSHHLLLDYKLLGVSANVIPDGPL